MYRVELNYTNGQLIVNCYHSVSLLVKHIDEGKGNISYNEAWVLTLLVKD